MHYLLIFGAFLLFVFTAPVKVTLATCAVMLVITSVVKALTHAMTGTSATYGDAFKAVGLAVVFMLIALFTMMSFAFGGAPSDLRSLPGFAMNGALFGSYVLGFSVALDTTFGVSAVIALISTAASALAIWAAAGLV